MALTIIDGSTLHIITIIICVDDFDDDRLNVRNAY